VSALGEPREAGGVVDVASARDKQHMTNRYDENTMNDRYFGRLQVHRYWDRYVQTTIIVVLLVITTLVDLACLSGARVNAGGINASQPICAHKQGRAASARC
jgi:hypothetical protein